MKRKSEQKKLTRRAVSMLLGSAALILFIALSLAIYTNQSYKKGVAITANSDAMFSSNILEQLTMGSTDYASRDVSVSLINNTIAEFSFDVYNYAPNMITRINPNDIYYNLTVTAVESDYFNSNTFTVSRSADDYNEAEQRTSENGGATVSNSFLKRAVLYKNTYTISMPRAAVDAGVRFIVKAEPGAEYVNAVNNKILAATIAPTVTSAGTTETNSWSARWVEKTFAESQTESEIVLKPQDCAAFNLEISGIGAGTVKLTCPTGMVVDSFFVEKIKVAGGSQNDNVITFPVVSETQSVYNVRFYRTDGTLEYSEETFSDWNTEGVFLYEAPQNTTPQTQ